MTTLTATPRARPQAKGQVKAGADDLAAFARRLDGTEIDAYIYADYYRREREKAIAAGWWPR